MLERGLGAVCFHGGLGRSHIRKEQDEMYVFIVLAALSGRLRCTVCGFDDDVKRETGRGSEYARPSPADELHEVRHSLHDCFERNTS